MIKLSSKSNLTNHQERNVMAKHTYSKCLVHLVWGTKMRKPLLTKEVRIMLSEYFYQYARTKEIFMYANFVNADHVPILFDLPTSKSIQEVAKLFKGSSSFWINKNRMTVSKFSWARGYGSFSVSQSNFDKVKNYILNQEEHHKKKDYSTEFAHFLHAHKLDVDRH